MPLDYPIKRYRIFYELIPVDTGSIELVHEFNPQDKQKIDFSKIRILKIISIFDWNKSIYIYTPKPFQ